MATESAEDVEAWAQAEGVPSLTDPFIQKYLSGRDALVEQEKKQRSGWWDSISKAFTNV
jgi:adenosine deaminase CECR1